MAKIQNNELIKIQRLVGDISDEDLENVDCYVSEHMGIFIPSVGFCKYAIRPSHTHPSYSFFIIFSEEQSFLKRAIELPDEHYLATVIEPDIPHEEEIADIFRRYIAVLISRDMFEGIYKEYYKDKLPENLIWKQFAVKHEIMVHIKSFMSEYENMVTGYENILRALSTVITHYLIRSLLEIDTKPPLFNEKFEMESIIEFMHQYFWKKITIAELSKRANMSQSHFIRVFKKETGLSPMDYLIRIRIEKAKKLLRVGTKSITEISLSCGFSSNSHFSFSFSKHAGVSPSEYQSLYAES